LAAAHAGKDPSSRGLEQGLQGAGNAQNGQVLARLADDLHRITHAFFLFAAQRHSNSWPAEHVERLGPPPQARGRFRGIRPG